MRAARLGRVHRVVDGEDDQLLAVELKGLHKDGHLGLVDQLQELRHLGGNETDLVRAVQLGQVEVSQVETWMRVVWTYICQGFRQDFTLGSLEKCVIFTLPPLLNTKLIRFGPL